MVLQESSALKLNLVFAGEEMGGVNRFNHLGNSIQPVSRT